jgi:hypothetical protein
MRSKIKHQRIVNMEVLNRIRFLEYQLAIARERLRVIATHGNGIKEDMIDWANIGKNSKWEAQKTLAALDGKGNIK